MAAVSARSVCLLLALSSGASALTVGRLRPTWRSCRTALVCREADATLLDPATGKTLKCLIAGTVVVEVPGAEDEVYGALHPAGTERAVLAVGRDGTGHERLNLC